jgi:CheY-like chemotaxis protein
MIARSLSCIMLIDNNPDDNYYHRRVIQKQEASVQVLEMNSATDALFYLQSTVANIVKPDLIFLDINMPGVNGWDFIEQYGAIKKTLNNPLIIMLTTSENPDDRKRAMLSGDIIDCMTKPLTVDMLTSIKKSFFK